MGQLAKGVGKSVSRTRIRSLLGLALILLGLALALPAGALASIGTEYSVPFSRSSASAASLASVTFADAAHGWAVGSYFDSSFESCGVSW